MAEFLIAKSIWPWLAYTLAALVHIFLIVNLVAVGALLFIWMERKVSGRIQDRLGPTRVGGQFGWLQTLADGLKLLTKEDLMPEGADEFSVQARPLRQLLRIAGGVHGHPVCWRRLSVCRTASERGRVLHPGRAGLGSIRRHSGRLFVGLEMVALRGHARSGPGGQLRSAARHVRCRSRTDCRVDGPGLHRRPAGRRFLELVHLPRSVYVRHLLGLLHLRNGQRQPRAVRPGRSGKRARGRVPHRVLRPAVELFLHGRIWLDAGRELCSPRFCFSAAGMGRFPSPDCSVSRSNTAVGTASPATCWARSTSY